MAQCIGRKCSEVAHRAIVIGEVGEKLVRKRDNHSVLQRPGTMEKECCLQFTLVMQQGTAADVGAEAGDSSVNRHSVQSKKYQHQVISDKECRWYSASSTFTTTLQVRVDRWSDK